MKKYFADWEGEAFGYGYGSGEEHIIPALMLFLSHTPAEGCYNYSRLESALTPIVAWLLINVLCKMGALEYGTSTRVAWLTIEGKRLKEFLAAHSINEIYDMTSRDDSADICYLNACNCGPTGYQEGVKCPNPFFSVSVK